MSWDNEWPDGTCMTEDERKRTSAVDEEYVTEPPVLLVSQESERHIWSIDHSTSGCQGIEHGNDAGSKVSQKVSSKIDPAEM